SPNVQVEEGTSRLVVDLPKVNDLAGVQKAIESQGSMEIRNGSGQVVATSADLKQNAKVVHDSQVGFIQVSLEFKDPKKWEDITKANLQRQISIYFNGTLKSSPVVQTVMTDGKSVISGNFSEAEANAVVAALNATPLPYPLLQVEQ
ncbi:MAG: SecDF P1 head subdomain-containing protein, partial [Tumebacillaceae bacterium]